MNISIPSSLRGHAPALKDFFEGMVFKLHVNSFKDGISDQDVQSLIDRGLEELAEFRDQYREKRDDPNTLQELFDMSNFNYLLFNYLRQRGVPDEREQFVNEFFRVDVGEGKVYAAKTRSGSRYKEGDEIKGTVRSGRVYIRIQHAVRGSMISCPRSDIIWFKGRGKWPDGPVIHKSSDLSNDSIDNLFMDEEDCINEDKFPFVFPHQQGDVEAYGYQRRHRGILLRVGYWHDRATAAREGTTAWKKRVKEMDDV